MIAGGGWDIFFPIRVMTGPNICCKYKLDFLVFFPNKRTLNVPWKHELDYAKTVSDTTDIVFKQWHESEYDMYDIYAHIQQYRHRSHCLK